MATFRTRFGSYAGVDIFRVSLIADGKVNTLLHLKMDLGTLLNMLHVHQSNLISY